MEDVILFGAGVLAKGLSPASGSVHHVLMDFLLRGLPTC